MFDISLTVVNCLITLTVDIYTVLVFTKRRKGGNTGMSNVPMKT